MPPVPKKKHTKARTGKRRGNIKLTLPNLRPCKNCSGKKLSHLPCPSCGSR